MDRFALAPFIRLGCPVASIAPLDKSGESGWAHRVKYMDREDDNKEKVFDCSHVAVCTGRATQRNSLKAADPRRLARRAKRANDSWH